MNSFVTVKKVALSLVFASGVLCAADAPAPQGTTIRTGMPGMEVEMVSLEHDAKGTFTPESIAKWAALAAQGYRISQAVPNGSYIYLLMERSAFVSGGELQLPAAVRGDAKATEFLTQALRQNRATTVIIQTPPAPPRAAAGSNPEGSASSAPVVPAKH